jgi:hypothetical protein
MEFTLPQWYNLPCQVWLWSRVSVLFKWPKTLFFLPLKWYYSGFCISATAHRTHALVLWFNTIPSSCISFSSFTAQLDTNSGLSWCLNSRSHAGQSLRPGKMELVGFAHSLICGLEVRWPGPVRFGKLEKKGIFCPARSWVNLFVSQSDFKDLELDLVSLKIKLYFKKF